MLVCGPGYYHCLQMLVSNIPPKSQIALKYPPVYLDNLKSTILLHIISQEISDIIQMY